MSLNKPCKKCGAVLPIESFNRNKGTLDGHVNSCRECSKKYSVQFRINNAAKVAASEKVRSSTPNRIAYRKRAFKEYDARNAGKHAARVRVKNAVRSGEIQKLPCMVCGLDAEAHHPDYSRPLDVVWLCRPHHRAAHNLIARSKS